MSTNDRTRAEKFFRNGDGILMASYEMTPVRSHQLYDELRQKQKEFACEIYIQRDKEKHL